MTWFSSGFSNLKEQINSLINDDGDGDSDGNGNGNVKYAENYAEIVSKWPDCDAETRAELSESDAVRNDQYGEQWCRQSPENTLAFDYHRHVVKYGRTLNSFVNDLNFLNTWLNTVAEDVERLAIKDDGVSGNGVAASIISRNGANDELASVAQSGSREDENRENCTRNKETQTTFEVAPDEIADAEQQLERNETSQEQIENLIIEMDELREKLSGIEEKWRKAAQGDVAIQTDSLTEYTTLAQRRDVLWEKVKVSFVWPTIAKYKNAKISELSVPDSIKEVFQPGFLARQCSDENTSASQQSQIETNQASVVNESLDEPANVRTSSSSTMVHHLQPSQKQEKNFSPSAAIQHDIMDKVEKQQKNEWQTCSASANVNVNANVAAIVEVERLRKHLLSVEQAYTNELLQCEQEIQILRGEIKHKEEKLNSITETYTCANISTNKTIEQLQQEIRQLAEDKTQLTTQLVRCENELEKTLVDTHNLRSALDLFRKNKDSEISQATEKLENRTRVLQNDNQRLREMHNSLRNDLHSLQQVYKENQFLNQQLNQKQNELYALKTKVDELSSPFCHREKDEKHSSNMAAAAAAASPDSEAKIKLNLIKNIVFTYIANDSPNTKMQSLRVLADVLQFSHYEKTKIGIISEQTSQTAANNQSLIDEFIRFVEKESHPKIVQARNQQREQEKARTTWPSVASTSNEAIVPIATAAVSANTSTRSAVLANTNVACSSSTILKDALNSEDI